MKKIATSLLVLFCAAGAQAGYQRQEKAGGVPILGAHLGGEYKSKGGILGQAMINAN